jgi:hypothetical protein
MARIVPQRHEHLAMPQPARQHVVLHNGDPAGIAVLVAKPLENPLRSMPLLSRPTFVRRQDPIDDPGKRIQLRTRRRPAPPVSGWDRKRQHLRDRPRVDPKTPRRFPPAHTFNLNRKTNLSVKLHALHPPAPAACRQRPFAAGFLLRPPDCPAASVRDFRSGAYTPPGNRLPCWEAHASGPSQNHRGLTLSPFRLICTCVPTSGLGIHHWGFFFWSGLNHRHHPHELARVRRYVQTRASEETTSQIVTPHSPSERSSAAANATRGVSCRVILRTERPRSVISSSRSGPS